MPSDDPNPNMDKLLRDYAKERRDAATPFEMHAATRKMLQGEVSRTLGKKDLAAETNNAPQLNPVFWRKFIWAGAAMAIAAVMLLSTVPFFSKTRQQPTRLAAMKEVARNTSAQTAAAPEPAYEAQDHAAAVGDRTAASAGNPAGTLSSSGAGMDTVLSAGEFSKNSAVVPAASRRVASVTDTLALNKVDQRTFSDKPAGTSGMAIGSGKQAAVPILGGNIVQIDTVAPRENRLSATVHPGSPAVKTPATSRREQDVFIVSNEPSNEAFAYKAKSGDIVGSAGVTPPKTLSQNFVQQDLRATYRRNLQSPPQPNVLSSFQIVWTDSKLKVTDADGSVYEGEIQKAPLGEQTMVLDESARTDASKAAEDVGQKQSFQNVSFRVSGQNRTLKQRIVFQGKTVIPPQSTVLTSLAKQTEPRSKAEKEVVEKKKSSSLPESNATRNVIEGSIIIGGTNEYRIQAIEAPE